MPQISVIVPVYNVEPYLDRCMGSLLAQTHNDYEIILVDDGSTDACPALCDSYAERFPNVRVVHQSNGGLSAARNTGLLHATGARIAFVDSDDWVHERYLEVLSEQMDTHNVDISMCAFNRSRDASTHVEYRPENAATSIYTADAFLDIMLRVKGNRCVHYAWGKLYERNVLRDGHFPEGLLNEDVEGTFKALLRSSAIAETTAPLYHYFVNPNSITGSAFGNNYLNLTEVWSRVLDIARSKRPDLVAHVEYNLNRTDFTILCDSIIHGNSSTDKAYSIEIAAHHQRLKKNLFTLLLSPMMPHRKAAMVLVAAFYKQIRYIKRRVTNGIH